MFNIAADESYGESLDEQINLYDKSEAILLKSITNVKVRAVFLVAILKGCINHLSKIGATIDRDFIDRHYQSFNDNIDTLLRCINSIRDVVPLTEPMNNQLNHLEQLLNNMPRLRPSPPPAPLVAPPIPINPATSESVLTKGIRYTSYAAFFGGIVGVGVGAKKVMSEGVKQGVKWGIGGGVSTTIGMSGIAYDKYKTRP